MPTEAPASDRRDPTTSSIVSTTPSRVMMPHAAATSPNARCRVRSGMIAVSRAASSAAMSAADPKYRSLTSFGLPSTHAISRRYQYGFPLITFLYRLAISLGHRRIRGRSQANTPKKPSSAHSLTEPQDIKVELAAKLGLEAMPSGLPL